MPKFWFQHAWEEIRVHPLSHPQRLFLSNYWRGQVRELAAPHSRLPALQPCYLKGHTVFFTAPLYLFTVGITTLVKYASPRFFCPRGTHHHVRLNIVVQHLIKIIMLR